MDCLQPAGACALYIFDQIIKEQNTRCANADHIDNVSICVGLRFTQADVGGHEDLLERAQHVSESIC